LAVKLIVPNKGYSETFHGVDFVAGVGIFEDEKLGKSLAETLGYEVEAVKDEPKKAPTKKAPAKKAPVKKKETE